MIDINILNSSFNYTAYYAYNHIQFHTIGIYEGAFIGGIGAIFGYTMQKFFEKIIEEDKNE